jgi:hypothetical protein
MSPDLDDCIVLREVHIYIGQPLEILRRGMGEGLCTEADDMSDWGRDQSTSGDAGRKP